MNWLLAIGAAYLLGSLPTALWFGRLQRGVDLREHGSGNLGATNVYRVLGPRSGITVLLLDAAKGAAAVGIARPLLPTDEAWGAILGLLAAILGHMFTPFAGFRGGKGVATAAGGWAAAAWLPLAIALGVWIVAFGSTRVVSIGSVSGAIALPIAVLLTRSGDRPASADPVFWAALLTAALLLLRHRENLARLLRGAEKPLALRGGANRPAEPPGKP